MGRRKRLLRDSPGQIVFDWPNVVIRCAVCDRVLRTEKSRRAGVGARCAKKRPAIPCEPQAGDVSTFEHCDR
jgi:hypothetical protein